MPLLRNKFQPYFLDPDSPNRRSCVGRYCYPLAFGDEIKQQWRQTPCGNNEITDPFFLDISLGAELLTDTSFPDPSPSWTSSPGGAWAPTGGVNSIAIYNASFPGGTYTQTGLAITPGTLYQFEITIGGLQTGDVMNLYLGSNTVTTIFDSNGTFQVNIFAGSDNTDIVFEADSVNNFSIDNVSLKEITFGSWDGNGQWVMQSETACKTTTGTGILTELVANYINAGGYYYLDFTVSSYGGGTLVPKVANVADRENTVINGNGIYRLYFLPTLTGVVSFEPSSDFIGCISLLDLRELRNDYTFELINPEEDSVDISSYATYWRDKVTLIVDINDVDAEFGCGYSIFVYDTCLTTGNNLITNPNFTSGSAAWSASPPTQFSVVGSQAVATFDPLTGQPNLCTNGDFSSGAAGWTATGWTIASGTATHNTGNTSPLSRSVNIGAIFTPPAYKVWWIKLTMSGRTSGSITIQLSDGTMGTYQDNGWVMWRASPTIGGGAVTFQIIPTSNFDGTIDDIVIVEQTTSWIQGVNIYNTANPAIAAGNYTGQFEIISITTTTPAGVAEVTMDILGMSPGGTAYGTTGIKTQNITGYVPGTQTPHFNVNFSGLDSAGGARAYPGEVIIDNTSLVLAEPFEATYRSECINYQNDFLDKDGNDTTRLLIAYSDQESYGFDFSSNTNFRLQQRIICRSIAPTYLKEKQVQKSGDGNARVAYAGIEKYWQFHTGLLDESAHDCLAAQIDQDHFIVGQNISGTEYLAEIEDYTPAWNNSGSFDLATAVINLRVSESGQMFNRHT